MQKHASRVAYDVRQFATFAQFLTMNGAICLKDDILLFNLHRGRAQYLPHGAGVVDFDNE